MFVLIVPMNGAAQVAYELLAAFLFVYLSEKQLSGEINGQSTIFNMQ